MSLLKSPKLAFFRQSGWMVMATGVGGSFMYLVHIVGRKLPAGEYGVYLAMLQWMNLMMIPALGLQTIFAQQTAAAITEGQERQLAFTVRRAMLAVTLIWLVMAGLVFLYREQLLALQQITNPLTLWLTLFIGLSMLWWPILQGVLQGQQDFLWLGSIQILNGFGRFAAVILLVWILGGDSASAVLAALIGFWLSLAVAVWRGHGILFAPGEPVDWMRWLKRALPLTLGLGASQFMMAADQLVVQAIFHRDVTAVYGAAGIIGRALVFLTVPVLAVMFPKVVRSAAKSERTDVLMQALGVTALLGGGAALACTIFPWLPLRIVWGTTYLSSAPMVPWFAWCMLPLTLANVLIGNLLARERFEAVPWLVLVAGVYGCALMGLSPHYEAADQFRAFRLVVWTIGGFSTLLLGVAVWFTWHAGAEGRGRSA